MHIHRSRGFYSCLRAVGMAGKSQTDSQKTEMIGCSLGPGRPTLLVRGPIGVYISHALPRARISLRVSSNASGFDRFSYPACCF